MTQICQDVWLAERPFYPRLPGLTSTDVGCKMAVVRLPSGGLWVLSPVGLTPGLKAALAELGPVEHIVTANTEHQKFAPQWIQEYPEAQSFACPGLRERNPAGGWGQTIGADSSGRWSTVAPSGGRQGPVTGVDCASSRALWALLRRLIRVRLVRADDPRNPGGARYPHYAPCCDRCPTGAVRESPAAKRAGTQNEQQRSAFG